MTKLDYCGDIPCDYNEHEEEVTAVVVLYDEDILEFYFPMCLECWLEWSNWIVQQRLGEPEDVQSESKENEQGSV